MHFIRRSNKLTSDFINGSLLDAEEWYVVAAGKRAVDFKKISLTLEEIMLRFRDKFGEDVLVSLEAYKFLGRIHFYVDCKGEKYNPCNIESQYYDSLDILVRIGLKPYYTYLERENGINRVVVNGEMKPVSNKMMKNIFLAIVLAVISYFIVCFLPMSIYNIISGEIVTPFFSKMISLISAIATPLVFFAVIDGIIGLESATALGKIGKVMGTRMLLSYGIAGVLTAITMIIVYPLSSEGSEGGGFLGQLIQLVLDIIPDNLFAPFTNDNDLQVVVIAIFVGVVILSLNHRVTNVKKFCLEVGDIVNRMMSYVCRFLPFVVYMGILNLLLTTEISTLVSVWKMFVMIVVTNLVNIIIMIIRVKVVTKVPFGVIFKKILPTLMINITTSSQVTALPENMRCCKEDLGIDGNIVDFACPFGAVVYMPNGAIFLGLMSLCLASVSGLPITASGVIKIVIVSIIIAIAAPPIPGSAFAVMPILFNVIGIPDTVYPLGVIFGTVLGYFLPALNGFQLQLEILINAIKLEKCDKEIMAKPL